MEPILARQSVILKCSMNASVLMGNYEFYYAGGLLCALAGKVPAQELQPKELYRFLQPLLDTYRPQNGQEAYLVKLLKAYKASGQYDAQMPELLQMGLKEEKMWVR